MAREFDPKCTASTAGTRRSNLEDNRLSISGLLPIVSRASGHATLRGDKGCNMLDTECQMAESASKGARQRDALARAESQIGEHWVLYLILGLVLLLGGLAAIAFPFLSTIAAKLALG